MCGEFIVQAERYRSVVPVNDVRALAGVMHDKRANHAIFVTSSWFSDDGRRFVLDNRPRPCESRAFMRILSTAPPKRYSPTSRPSPCRVPVGVEYRPDLLFPLPIKSRALVRQARRTGPSIRGTGAVARNRTKRAVLPVTMRDTSSSGVAPPAGFEPALPPPESGTRSNSRSALTSENEPYLNAEADDLGAYWAWWRWLDGVRGVDSRAKCLARGDWCRESNLHGQLGKSCDDQWPDLR